MHALQYHTKSATSYGVWGHAQRSILSALNRYFNENQKQGKQKLVHLEMSEIVICRVTEKKSQAIE